MLPRERAMLYALASLAFGCLQLLEMVDSSLKALYIAIAWSASVRHKALAKASSTYPSPDIKGI